jgi:hypothetical protein
MKLNGKKTKDMWICFKKMQFRNHHHLWLAKIRLKEWTRSGCYNLWQYRLGQSSFHMHSVVIYHFLIHFFHPSSPHPFQCWRLATRHQVFVGPTLNWGNGGRYW